ncbi:MAG: hypothetical protein ACLTKE_04800 [Coprococcus sp.]
MELYGLTNAEKYMLLAFEIGLSIVTKGDTDMDSNTILSNILQEEIQYFYNYIRDYDEKRIIDIAMVMMMFMIKYLNMICVMYRKRR